MSSVTWPVTVPMRRIRDLSVISADRKATWPEIVLTKTLEHKRDAEMTEQIMVPAITVVSQATWHLSVLSLVNPVKTVKAHIVVVVVTDSKIRVVVVKSMPEMLENSVAVVKIIMSGLIEQNLLILQINFYLKH